MLIVTTNGIPGYRVEAVLGQVMGMAVRRADLGGNGAKRAPGGEVPEYTKLVYDSRNEVMNRMWQNCVQRGGNAIVGMRFDTGDIAGSCTEVCAYGTAVVVAPLAEGEPGATPQSMARAAALQPGPGNWPTLDNARQSSTPPTPPEWTPPTAHSAGVSPAQSESPWQRPGDASGQPTQPASPQAEPNLPPLEPPQA